VVKDGLVPVPALDAPEIGRSGQGQLAQRLGDELERFGFRPLRRGRQQDVERLGRDREHVVLVADRERDPVPRQAQIAVLEHAAVVVGQHRQEHDVAQAGLWRIPVDVEVRRVAARRAVFQHVPPPRVVGADRHVIRDDVEHLAEAGAPQRLGQARVAWRAAELAVGGSRIDDVVAVRAALRRLQIRRAVGGTHAERRGRIRDRRGRGEVEAGVELHPIGGGELPRHVSADDRPARLGGETGPCAQASPAPPGRTTPANPVAALRYLPRAMALARDLRHTSHVMLIAQITDTHIKPHGALAYGRVDTAPYLARALAHLLALRPRPDVVLATGDLVDGGRPDEYRRLRDLLAPLAMPVYLIPGNHDEREALAAAFPDHAYLPRGGRFMQYVVEGYAVRLI